MVPRIMPVEAEVGEELSRIYCSRVPIVSVLAAALTFALTAVDIAGRQPVDAGMRPTDINSLAFAALASLVAVVGFICRRRQSGRSHGTTIATVFIVVAMAHGAAAIFTGTSLAASETYVVIILLAAAGGIPLSPPVFTAIVLLTGVASGVGLAVTETDDRVLSTGVVILAGLLSLAIDFENYRHWVTSIRSRLHETRIREQLEEFLSILAHDLRGPIGAMRELVSMVRSAVDAGDTKTSKEFLDHLDSSVAASSGLLENLLLWARSRRESLELQLSQTTVGDQVTMTERVFAPQAERKGVALRTDVRYNPSITTDSQLLQTVLRNIVGNAVKYTGEGDSITITTLPEDRGRRCAVRVQDTGMGMEEDRIRRLFSLDRQASTPGTAGEPGTGLGLVLVGEISRRLEVEIAVESEPGRGTTVSLLVPVERDGSDATE